jgi:hypothetical protein
MLEARDYEVRCQKVLNHARPGSASLGAGKLMDPSYTAHPLSSLPHTKYGVKSPNTPDRNGNNKASTSLGY